MSIRVETPMTRLIDIVCKVLLGIILFLIGLSVGSNCIIKKTTTEIREMREKIECLEQDRLSLEKGGIRYYENKSTH